MNRHQRRAAKAGGSRSSAEELNAQGLALVTARRPDAAALARAVTAFGRAVEVDPLHAEAAGNLGAALHSLGRHAEAIAASERCILLDPAAPRAHYNRGLALKAVGRLPEAVISYKRSLAVRPGDGETHNNLGVALEALGRPADAEAAFRAALALSDQDAEAWNNLGVALAAQGRFDEGIAACRRAIALRENYADAELNLGAILFDCGRFAEAAQAARRAIGLAAERAAAHNNLGTALQALGQTAEAAAAFRAALARQPDFAEAHYNLATALLQDGDYAEGWSEYEWRWKGGVDNLRPRSFDKPLWAGEEPAGRTILLHAEQGLGDTLQFCRYAALLAARGARVVLEVYPPLKRLLASLPGVAAVVATGEALPAFDWHLPLLSAPLRLGTRLDTIPAETPYLAADPAQVAAWRGRLNGVPGLKVGLVWSGDPRPHDPLANAVDRRRSIPLADLAPLLGIRGAAFVSLQKGRAAAALDDVPAEYRPLAVMDQIGDFADTAAVVANLDLVISVDTSVAHLAGAMGKPVWILSRFDGCWRWLKDRDDSPWYPTARLFRQSAPGDWRPVVRQAAAALAALTGAAPADCRTVTILPRPERSGEVPAPSGSVDPAPLFARALRQHQEGQPQEAERLYRQILDAVPDHPAALYNLGLLTLGNGRAAEAAHLIGRAVARKADDPTAFYNLGVACQEAGRSDDAVEAYGRALALRPDYAQAQINRGAVLLQLRRVAEALADDRAALALRPDDPAAHYNLGVALLLQGDYRAGWPEFEWRWRGGVRRLAPRRFAQPQWQGEDPAGKTILLHGEQGFGDMLQFARFASTVAASGGRPLLEVHPALVRLLKSVPGVAGVFASGAPLPAFDCHLPMMSAPAVLGTTLESVPATVPYVAPDAGESAAWAARLAERPGFKVGLAWAGEPRPDDPESNAIDRRRSMSLAQLAPVLQVPGVTFVSLQKGQAAAQLAEQTGGCRPLDWMDEIDDFAGTAALVANLDLVICVDTAVAHLAGALGVPVWIASRFDGCWRWLLDREDSPWYPTVRLFRQTAPGDWAGVAARLAAALGERAAAPPAERRPGSAAPTADPRAAERHFAQGLALHRQGRLAAAEPLYRRALDTDPGHARAQYNWGLIALQQNDFAAAAERIGRAVALDPDNAEAQTNLGTALQELRRYDEAIVAFRASLARHPDDARVWFNLGLALGRSGRPAEAAAAHRAALCLDPALARAQANLGTALTRLGDPSGAETACRRAVACAPDYAEALSDLGAALFDQGRFAEAVGAARAALALQPGAPWILTGLAVGLQSLRRVDEARTAYRRAMQVDPGYPDAHFNLGISSLLAGDLSEGWREFEWRWSGGEGAMTPRRFPKPRWAGEDLAGRTLLLTAEQGLGDILQFARFAAPLAARGARVVLEAYPPLKRLMASVPGVAQVVAGGEPLPDFDYHLPVMSAPHLLGTTLETIPAAVPYLSPDPTQAAAWRRRLAKLPGLKVGLVWGGNARPGQPRISMVDRRRSLALAQLAPLLAVPGVSFVSLQKGPPAAQLAELPEDRRPIDWMDEVEDFADTAALADGLDLVISVDTSVVHLAGALGKPVWILSRFDGCWRWLLDREDSPWYPTARLFRQTAPGDWDTAVAGAAAALQALTAAGPAAAAAAPEAVLTRAIALHRQGRFDEAETLYRQALAARPEWPEALTNLGCLRRAQGRLDEALAIHRDTVQRWPEHAALHNNLGVTCKDLHRPAEAIAAFRTAIRLNPEHAAAHANLSVPLLLLGQFAEGWEEYEWRWRGGIDTLVPRDFAQPLWTGQALTGRTLLLHAEQGFGDTLQFCRYAALLAGRGARVVLEVQPALKRLLGRLAGVAQVVAGGEPLPPFDYHLPLLSAPHRLGTRLDSIPAAIPYLAADPDASRWADRLAALPGLKVGLVWAGDGRPHDPSSAAVDRRRSMALAQLAPLLALPGISVVSLQKGPPAAQLATLPAAGRPLDWMGEVADFADTAALMAGLDLVISVDTAVAHLAGAMGKPVWILSRFDGCWRWLLDRDDSPWYPSARLFRQPAPGDWAAVVARVAAELARLAGRPTAAPLPPPAEAPPSGIRPTGILSAEDIQALFGQAVAAHQAGRLAEAEQRYLDLLARPGVVAGRAELHNNLGVLLRQQGRLPGAAENFRRAVDIRPDYAEALNNLGLGCNDQGRPAEAQACYRRALTLRPADPQTWTNLGVAAQESGRPAEAARAYRRAVALHPGLAGAHYNLGQVLLLQGDYAEGWREHDWLWRGGAERWQPRPFTQPRWTGEPLAGRTLLLYGEQGLGDILQFCRYAGLIAQRGERVVLEVAPSLKRLCASLPGVVQVVARGEPLPPFDLQLPLMGVPSVLGTTLDSVPAAIPYLRADPADSRRWAERLGRLPGLKVGLVWAGDPRTGDPRAHAVDRRRSMPLAVLAPLLAQPGITFVSLQKGDAAAQLAALPPAGRPLDWMDEIGDFADTAALVANLDLVITVDTAVAHLAGALGRTVWIASRFDGCWRWLLDREDSPWYPTARLFRQTAPGDWQGVARRLAEALQQLGRRPAAAADRKRAERLHRQGLDARKAGKLDEAARLLGESLAAWPDQAEARNSLGVVRLEQGDLAAAEAEFRRSVTLRPAYAEALSNLASVLGELRRWNEALAPCRRAVALKPDFAKAHSNLGVLCHELGRLDEAEAHFRTAIRLVPGEAEPHYNLGTTQLLRGAYAEGWREFEWRLAGDPPAVPPRGLPGPAWTGEPLAGRTILLHGEQGLGDVLQFARYATLLAEQGARVVVEVPRSLKRLMTTLPGVAQVVVAGEPLPAFDCHLSMMSAPCRCGTTLETIPAAIPYLSAEPRAAAAWAQRLAALPGRKVGLVWAGDPRPHDRRANTIDRRRSMTLAQMDPLLRVPGVTFVSLQKGSPAKQLAALPPALRPIDWMDEVGDFADTAALMAGLDLVISVDTSVVHLAGALGKPVWIASRFDGCWRWLLDREDSPWYPTARLFRQDAPGDWQGVVTRLKAALEGWTAQEPAAEAAMPPVFAQALAHHRAGRLAEAEQLYLHQLEAAPDHFDSLHHLGILALAAGDAGRAVQWLGKAILQDRRHLGAHVDLGRALALAGRGRDALLAFAMAVGLDPEDAEARYQQGVALHDQGRAAEAGQAYRQALALRPDHAAAWTNLGSLLGEQAQLEDAVAACRRALAADPRQGRAQANLEAALAALAGRTAAPPPAAAPEVPADAPSLDALFAEAVEHHRQGRLLDAEQGYRAILARQPDQADVLQNCGLLAQQRNQPEAAARLLRRVLSLRPASLEAWTNLAVTFNEAGDAEAAAPCFRRAVLLRPDLAEPHNNMGGLFRRLGRLDQAIAAFRQALALAPGHPEIHCNLAAALLERGDYAEGWREHEWRLHPAVGWQKPPPLPEPEWDGGPLAGRTILLRSEQGYGDDIQFARFATPIAAAGGHVVLDVPAALCRLLATVEGVAQVVARGEPLPPIDCQLSLMSAPSRLGVTLDNLPAAVPYVGADAGSVARWGKRLARLRGLKVGLVWAGDPRPHDRRAHDLDRRRSMALGQLAPLFALPGIRLVSLQKGTPAAQIGMLPPEARPLDLMDEVADFADTAAVVANLDLVISVDTAVAHLAGALGKPVWILSRFDGCWRWLRDRDDSPWYPTARLFRQTTPGDWAGVVERVAAALRELTAATAAPIPAVPIAVPMPAPAGAPEPTADEAAARLAEAFAHHQAGRLAEAEALYRQILDAVPDQVVALHHLGLLARRKGDGAELRTLLQRACRLAPGYAEAHSNLGAAFSEQGNPAAAVACCRQALAAKPDYPHALINLGKALKDRGAAAEAAACYRRALTLDPLFALAWSNLGAALQDLDRLEEAAACLHRALALVPDQAAAENNLGAVRRQQGDTAAALGHFRRAVALAPQDADAHFHLGMTLLLTGAYAEGWREYEWRSRTGAVALGIRPRPEPRWRGEPLAGRTILLAAEQGLGDALQFVRYAPLIAARGGRVVLEVHPPLKRLLASVPGVAQVAAMGEPLPPVDCHLPLMSAPLVLGTDATSIPAPIPYVTADAARKTAWGKRLADRPGLKVGLVWAGNPRSGDPGAHLTDRRRSMALAGLAPLLRLPGLCFVSLQKGAPAAELAGLPAEIRPLDWMAEIDDFADTAALVANLDLVISVDTSVAHLAGALGVPLWIASRFDGCWRWLDDRDDSPWYPTARLFRQPAPGDWDSVVARMTGELATRIAAPPAGEPRDGRPPDAARLFAEAVEHHRAGRLDQAERRYRQILADEPKNVGCLFHLGLVAQARQRHAEAVPLLAQACLLNGSVAPLQDALGSSLAALGRLTDAAACHRQALALKPDFIEALFNLGNAEMGLGNRAAARICFQGALAWRPELAEPYNNLGMLLSAEDPAAAADAFRRATLLAPDGPAAHNNLGNACKELGRFDEAETAFRQAIRLQPDHVEAHYNLANLLFERGVLAPAIAGFERAIAMRPELAQAYTNLGSALYLDGDTAAGIACFSRSLALDPNAPEIHANLGTVLGEQGRLDEAIAAYRQAIACDPDYALAHSNLAVVLLRRGEYAEGFREFEWRRHVGVHGPLIRAYAEPPWTGQPLAGRTLLLHAEQGLGDVLQFVRYASVLAAQGATVIVEAFPPLTRLLASVPGVARVVPAGSALPPFDWHLSMMSAPYRCGTTLATIPAEIPYVTPAADQVAAWGKRLGRLRGLKVGLVWSGDPRPHDVRARSVDRRRSIRLAAMAPLLALPGVSFVSLQKGVPARQIDEIPPELRPLDLTEEMNDFADTAALAANLDLVISVDTSVAHLAGAMGKPVWVLNRFDGCWRWLLDREDSPWYPTARLFRQPAPGDWSSVIARVADALAAMAGRTPSDAEAAGMMTEGAR